MPTPSCQDRRNVPTLAQILAFRYAEELKGREDKEHIVTYQITMSGRDGMVIASDRCERLISSNGKHGVNNQICKIQLNTSKKYAWAFWGGFIAPIFSKHFSNRIEGNNATTEQQVLDALAASVLPAFEEWQITLSPDGPKGGIVLACGPTKRIFRSDMSRSGATPCASPHISGAEFNLAAFVPQRFYSIDMTVDELAALAAYSICAAHDIDSASVEGLNVAVYRDSTGRFDFYDGADFEDQVEQLDRKLKACFTKS